MTNKTLALVLISLILLVAACGGQPAATPDQDTGDDQTALTTVPARPVITLSVAGEAYEGLAGAYCWPQAADDIRCEPDPLDPQPDEVAAVQAGDEIEFIVAEEAGAPSTLTAHILGSTDDDGDPLAVNFGPTNTGVYPVDLDAGEQGISVVAEFQNIEGDNSFITYYFALDVSAAVAEAATPESSATDEEADEETDEATAEATAEGPVAIPTKDDSAAEVTPTQEMMEDAATEEADEVAVVPTKGSGSAAEEDAATEEPADDMAATDEADDVEPTEDSAEVESEPTAEEPVATDEPTAASPTDVPPTDEPTAVPPTPVPTAPADEADEAPEPGEGSAPPAIVVVNGDKMYQPSGVEYCTPGADGSQICVDMPATTTSERILLNNNSTLRIDAADGGPQAMTIALTNNDLTQVLDSLDIPGNAIALYAVTVEESGNYMLRIDANWDNDVATYYFRLQILG